MPQDGASNPLITVTFFPEQMNLTPQQLDEVIEKYCDRVVDEMDTKSMEQMLYDLLVESFSQSNQNDMEELICAIYDEEYWQELVESVTVQ